MCCMVGLARKNFFFIFQQSNKATFTRKIIHVDKQIWFQILDPVKVNFYDEMCFFNTFLYSKIRTGIETAI